MKTIENGKMAINQILTSIFETIWAIGTSVAATSVL